MDENKLQKLVDIDYRISSACGLCVHGDFRDGNDFGSCKLHTYRHLKHSADSSALSVFKYGTCGYFELKDETLTFVDGFSIFMGKM